MLNVAVACCIHAVVCCMLRMQALLGALGNTLIGLAAGSGKGWTVAVMAAGFFLVGNASGLGAITM